MKLKMTLALNMTQTKLAHRTLIETVVEMGSTREGIPGKITSN